MYSESELESLLELATRAAQESGEMLYRQFLGSGDLIIERKEEGINNLVTEMDRKAEEMIRDILSERPDIIFLGEESGGDADLDRLTWVVDPIDGTVNYAHGLPIWSVSIAAVKGNEPLVGVIRNPNLDETFTAVKDGGAFLNGKQLSVSDETDFRRAFLVTGFPYNVNENPHGTIDVFGDILRNGNAVRRLGSAALDLAYVAAGRFEAFWEISLHSWDVAAGLLLVNEAGGMVSTYGSEDPGQDLEPTRQVVVDRLLATNGRIHREMVEALGKKGN